MCSQIKSRITENGEPCNYRSNCIDNKQEVAFMVKVSELQL